MSLEIVPLRPSHRARWDTLARAYKDFYETVLSDAEYDRAWHRLLAGDGIHGLGAEIDGRLVGLAHYLFHKSVWAETVCYLQDLFVAKDARKLGLGRALIEAVYKTAHEAGASRVYWLTHESNATARSLYDKLSNWPGFIVYRHLFADRI